MILTSVIIAILNRDELTDDTVSCILQQTGNYEIIVAKGHSTDQSLASLPDPVKIVSSTGDTRGMLLNDGAAAAKGDVFLFLWPDSRLPVDALMAIERNFKVLPQTSGGNFYLKFDDNTLFTRLLTRFLKQWRYRGRYYGNSGIFIRRVAYEALGGFRPYNILEDYDFARRMEKYGPTLNLPTPIIASSRKFRERKLKAALIWPIMQSLFMVGLHPTTLGRIWTTMK